MKIFFVSLRNILSEFFYKGIFKRIFFLFDPESMHDFATYFGHFLGSNFITRWLTAFFFSFSHKSLEQGICGIRFKNPVGLAAGFDKDGRMLKVMSSVGFGFEEVGSVTGEPCEGNPKPRLWRLVKSKALVVYFGLKSEGCEKVAQRLRASTATQFPIGISIAKTNSAETVEVDDGIADYVKVYKKLEPFANYITINISCPNAFGGQPFSDPERLDKLLSAIAKIQTEKPVFIKMPPDLKESEIDEILDVVAKYRIAGFVCSNLTKDRQNKTMMSKIVEKDLPEHGGISGKPVEDLSNNLIDYLYKKTDGKYVLIGCGGIFSAEDAYKKIKLGASLVQLITGMIFEGPQLISQINVGLVKLLKKDGFKNVSEAVGKGLGQVPEKE